MLIPNLWRSSIQDSEEWKLWMRVLWVKRLEDLKIKYSRLWRLKALNERPLSWRIEDLKIKYPRLWRQKFWWTSSYSRTFSSEDQRKINVVSEDSEHNIILSEVNKKVHCADNIVQRTCKSWQDVTVKLQKVLCCWEHAKSTFYLTTVTYSRLSIKGNLWIQKC